MPTFPVEIFPEWIKDYIEGLSKELNTQVDLPAHAVLSVLSVPLIKKFKFLHKPLNWELHLNIYIVLFSDPGSKKDAVLNRVFKVLFKHQRELLKQINENEARNQSDLDVKKNEYERIVNSNSREEISIDELEQLNKDILRLESELKKRFFIVGGDITQEKITELLEINNEILTISTSEASEMFDHLDGRYKVDSLDIYLKAWEGTNYAKLRSTTDDIFLEQPLLNLCLFSQPQEIQRLSNHNGRGLMQRFLVSVPDRYPKEKISLENTMPPTLIHTFNENIKELLNTKVEEIKTVTVDPLAWDAFNNLYLDIIYESYEDVTYTTQQWLMKIFGNLVKIVSIIKIVDEIITNGNTEYISLNETDIKKMRTLFEYYYEHFKKVSETNFSKETELEFFFRRLLEINKDHNFNGVISSTDINNHIKRINKKDREIMLEKLEENHLVRVIKKGRKKTVYINPEIIKRPHKEALNFVRVQKNKNIKY